MIVNYWTGPLSHRTAKVRSKYNETVRQLVVGLSIRHTSTDRVGKICKIAKWSFTISNFWTKMAKNWHSWPKNRIHFWQKIVTF
jgi:hypothetical protein